MINKRTGVYQQSKSFIIPQPKNCRSRTSYCKDDKYNYKLKIDSIFQRFFNSFIFIYNDYKYSNIILEEHNQKFLFIGILKIDHIVVNNSPHIHNQYFDYS
jgi:hypothetical protein